MIEQAYNNNVLYRRCFPQYNNIPAALHKHEHHYRYHIGPCGNWPIPWNKIQCDLAWQYNVSVFDGSHGTRKEHYLPRPWRYSTRRWQLMMEQWHPKSKIYNVNPSGTTRAAYTSTTSASTAWPLEAPLRLDVRQNVTGIPIENNYYLTIKAKTDGGESYEVQVNDSGSWTQKFTISGTTSQCIITRSPQIRPGGKVQIRYVDTTISFGFNSK